MAANVQYSLGVNADTGQAKKAISELQRSIDNLSKMQINTNYLDKGINDAVAAAKELEYHLNAALNQNTGKLNLNAFTQSLADSNTSAKDLMQTLLQGGTAGQQTFTSLANAIAQSEVPLRRANKTLQDFATTLKNTVKWEISSTMVHSLESALSGAVSYAKNLNTSLTNIRIVTGQSVDDMARFAKEANAAAKALSTTTKSYADASLIYYQQGDSAEMAAKKAAITIKASNASFETSAKEMSEYLTAVWNSYQVGADELERYVDIMANLGAKTATSLEEIATSMQKVAATANTVGVSMEQVSSIIATVSSVTRESAESIGTSYKTIFARIGDLKLGKVDEDGVGLGQVSSQLDAIGVKILDESGNLREMGDIIMDLGTRWQTMNQAQKTAVAQVVAGKRQYTQLMALFENWDMFQGNMNIAENSEGSLQRMADIYAESWEAASARVQASMEGIYNKILNDQAIIKLTNGLASIVETVDTLIDGFGGLGGVIASLGSIGIKVFSKEISGGINKTINSIKTYTSQFSGFGDFITKGFKNEIQSNEQINYKKSLDEWDKNIAEVKTRVGADSAEAATLQHSKDLLNVKQQLVNVEHSLSDAQKARAQSLISQMATEQEQALKYIQQKEQLTKDMKSNQTSTKRKILNAARNDYGESDVAVARDTLNKYLNYDVEAEKYTKATKDSIYAQKTQNILEKAKTGSLEEQEQAIKRVKKIISEKVDSNFFDDFSGDINDLIEKLKNLEKEAQETADNIETSISTNEDLGEETKRAVQDGFDQILEDADQEVDLEFNIEGAEEQAESISEKITELLDKDSEFSQSLGETITAVAGTASAMFGGFEAGASAVSAFTDETAELGDKLASVSGIISNLAAGFASGGIYGLILTGLTTAVSAAIQWAKEKEKEYQEAQQADLDRMIQDSAEQDAELSNIQTLMKNYNSLKETYLETGDGQDALAASARELAEAYGLVGTNVLIAEGNFAAFERMIAQSTGLKQVEEFYQGKIDAIKADMNDTDRRSKYAISNEWSVWTREEMQNLVVPATSFTDNADASDYIGENMGYALEHYTSGKYKEAEELMASTTAIVEANRAAYSNALSDKARYEDMLTPGGVAKKRFDPLGPNTIATNDWWGQDNQRFNSSKMEKGAAEIRDYFSDIATEESQAMVDTLISEWNALGTEAKNGDRIISDSAITNFISRMEKARTTLIQNALDSATATMESLLETDGTFIGEAEQAAAQAELDKIKTEVTSNLTGEFAEGLKEASGLTEDQTEYFDYTTGLLDEEGRFNYTEENKIDWHRQVDANLDKLYAEQNAIKLYRDTHAVQEGSAIDKALKQREEDLAAYQSLLESVYNKDLAEAIAQMDTWENARNRAKIINDTIKKMFGKSEQNTDYSVFDAWVKKLEEDVAATALADERFKDVIEEDVNAKNGYKIKEGYDEEFRAIRDQIVSGYISDFTSFDDYLAIYKDLAAIFTDSDDYEAARTYIDSKKIKDARLVNNRLIHAMQTDLANGDTVGANAERVLTLNQQELDAEKSIETYNNITSLASGYKDDLSFDDALALQQALIEDGNIAWEDFIAMDSDARKTYLESRRDAMLEAAKTAQTELAENARKEQELLYATEMDYEEDKRLTDIFFDGLEENFEYEEETGKYKHKTLEGVYADEGQVAAMEARRAKMQDYESWGNVAEDAEAAAAAFELLDSNNERAVTKIQRMKKAISELPIEMEEFNKLVAQLGNVDPKKLIEMSDLERAQLILKELEKPTEAQFTVIDEETGEKVFNAAGYNEAMQEYEAARLEAVDVILASANAAFTQIENRMNHAREEAEKIKTIAETLSGAIETGELTETQKLGMSPELIQQWEKAADAPARAAIAMKQWNDYAVENAKATREILTTYEQAQKVGLTGNSSDIAKLGSATEGRDAFRNILAESNIAPALQEVWLKAWDNLTSKGVDFSGLTFAEITTKLRSEMTNMGDLTKEEMAAVTAMVTDNMAQMFQELHDQNIEEARAAADAWREAFDLINDAKLKLLSGESILEMIAGDPQAIMTLAQQMGISIQELVNGAMSGTLDSSKLKDFDLNEYVNSEMAAAGMFEGFGQSIRKDMIAQGMTWDQEDGWTDSRGNKVSERQVLEPIYKTMLEALNPTATSTEINNWLDEIFTDPGAYVSRLVNPMAQLEQATIGAGQALNAVSDQQLIEAAADITQQEADFRGQKVEYDDLTEVQAAIERAQDAKYAGKSWESLSQEDRDLLGQYGIDFTNVDTAANECATALAACAQAALDLMKATAEQEGYSQNTEGEWGQRTYTAEDGTIYTEATGRDKFGDNWDQYKRGLTDNGWVKSEGVTEQFTNAQDAIDKANAAVNDVDSQTVEKMASSIGMTADEFDRYAETLYKVNGGTKEFNELSAAEKQELRDTARLSQMAAEGWKEIKESQEDNIKTIKKGDKTNADYYKSLSSLTKSVKKAFGGCEAATEEFVEAHMDDIEKMAKGDVEAAERIESALLMEDLGEDVFNREVKFDVDQDGVTDDLGTIGSMLSTFGDEWRDKPIGFEATLDNTPALAGLQALLDSGHMTVDQMNAALATIGWAPEIEYEVVKASDKQAAYTTGALQAGQSFIGVNGQVVTVAEGYIAIPKIKSARKTGGGSSGASRPSGGGKGGGGGGKTPEKKDKVRGRDEIERYHKQNDTIDRLASSIEKIDKLKDRAYGKDHLAQIDAETEALNKQLLAQQDLHNEALKWMSVDKASLEAYGAEYDENGTIVNYEKVMERIIDEYNAAIETYNNSGQGDGDKLALEAAEQRFEDAKKAIENYEEALTIANDSANEMLEIQNQMSELEVEKITYELELKLDMNERDLELLEYYQDKYENQLDKQDELFNTFLGSMAEYESNLANLGTAYEQLNAKFVAGLINEADYAEAVADLQSQIVDNLSSLNEIQEQLIDTYANTLSLAREEVEKTTDAIDHSNEAMQSFMDIMALSGSETDYKKMGEFYKIMNENNLTKIEVQRAHLDALLAEEQRFKDKVGEMTELEKQQYAALQEEIQDTRDTLLSSTQEALETIRSTYENTINDIAQNLDDFMAGAAGSMSYLQEQYGYFQEQQDRYVSTARELYEVSKLNRDIEGTLATATTDASKEALKALQEKINKQSELNELTEYDIEMNQLQYQLLLARIQLEEAQNAKDVVRLTRDENGNYAYRYTANQDKIDEAAQHYEDLLQQINDNTVQQSSEIEQQLLNTMANYKEKFQEIATDYTLTEEERLRRLQDLNNQFAETMRYLQAQNSIVTENLTANQEAIAEHYGVSMSAITASTAGNINNTVQSMMDKTEEYINAMNAAIFGESGAKAAWYEYMSQIGDIEGVAGTAYENMLEDAQDMGEMNEFAAEEALEVIQTLEDTLQPLANLSAAWDAHNAILETTISDYERLAENMNAALAVASGFANTVGVGGADGSTLDMAALGMISSNDIDVEDVYAGYQKEMEKIAQDTTLTEEAKVQILQSYNEALASLVNAFGTIQAGSLSMPNYNETLEQSVQIAAEFPNVTNHTEVEEALMNLINQAAQFAQRKN